MGRQVSRDRVAALAGLAAPLALTAVLVPFRVSLPNIDAALALALVVVAVAATGRRAAGVLAAVWFDFFLTVPHERLTITRRADIETTVLILAVGIAVTEIAVRGRPQHPSAARRGATWTGSAPLPARSPPGPGARLGCCPTAGSTSPGRPETPGSPGFRRAGTPSCWPRRAVC